MDGAAGVVEVELDAPLDVARWRPFFAWVPAIPHLVVLSVAGNVIWFVVLAAWLVALFTGRVPDGLAGAMAWYHRYTWRTLAYAAGLRGAPWPAFDVTFATDDPGGDPARWVAPEPAEQGRASIFFRWLLVLPAVFVFAFVAVAASVVWAVGSVVVVVTGAWPAGMREFLVGAARWGSRINGYAYLLTDRYPPFTTGR